MEIEKILCDGSSFLYCSASIYATSLKKILHCVSGIFESMAGTTLSFMPRSFEVDAPIMIPAQSHPQAHFDIRGVKWSWSEAGRLEDGIHRGLEPPAVPENAPIYVPLAEQQNAILHVAFG